MIQKDENVTLKMEVESSEESNSQENVKKEVDLIITNLDAKKSEKDKIVKQVTFVETTVTEHSACIDTIAQLDDTFILDKEGNSPPVTDTGQDAKTVIKSVLSEIIEAVAIQADEGDDQGSGELSSTPLCSQMPHIDPYACKKETSNYEIR